MGTEAEKTEDLKTEEATEEVIDGELTEDVDKKVDESEDKDDEVKEIEIVREGTQPQDKKFTQQQVDDIVSKRVQRLNSKVDFATSKSNESSAELELQKERNKLLELALEQAKADKIEKVEQPNPDDYEEGVHDPAYITAQTNYTNAIIAKQVNEQVAEATKNVSETNDQAARSEALLRKQEKHYERANEIGAKDYVETEDKALEILGNEVANEVINNFDDSHVILYYLGKNPNEASRISTLLKTNPIKGVAEVGRLSAELKIKPKTKTTTADPDEDIQGDSANTDALHKRLDKLREKAAETGDMRALMEFKKKHKL